MKNCELTKDEAYAVADFIAMNLIEAIRDNEDIDSMYWLSNIIRAYDKLCEQSGYVWFTVQTEPKEEEPEDG